MQYWALISLLVLIAPFLIGDASAATWYNSSWLKARQINITQTDIDSNLTNYPLYVNLTSVNIGTDAQADCDDFVFTDSTNVTKLDHEIETCDAANDWAEFWVEVPTVDSNVDTVIFLYYDNAVAGNQQNTQATWNSNYQFVGHLNGTFIDSTSSPITCTNSGSSAILNDYIGDSQSFDKVDDYIDCTSTAKIDAIFNGGGTISAWINATDDGESAIGKIMSKDASSTAGWYAQVQTLVSSILNVKFEQAGTIANGNWRTTNQQLAVQKWSLVTITYNDDSESNDPTFYLNGTSFTVGSGLTKVAGPLGLVPDSTQTLCIGNDQFAAACSTFSTFNGRIDEVRLYDITISSAWAKADWECQRGAVDGNSCIIMGSQGTEPAAGGTVTISDEIAIEDVVSAYGSTVTVIDDIALEDIGPAFVNVNDDIAIEDTASASAPGIVTVTDDIAIEDQAGTNTVTLHDDIALEDTTSNSATTQHANAIVLYINPATAGRLGGVFSGVCDFGNNYTMTGIFSNGTIRCNQFAGGGGGGDNLGNHQATQTLLFKVFSDVTRPACAAGLQGGVIFNTSDMNLNICDGTNWILPDGTIT